MLSQSFIDELTAYISKMTRPAPARRQPPSAAAEKLHADVSALAARPAQAESLAIEDYLQRHRSEETFSTLLLKYIDRSRKTDAEIYKAAGVDRRHFSKIRGNRDYRPSKPTALALCLALELSKREAIRLLSLAGYSFSAGSTGDLVVAFCIEKGIYSLTEVNEALAYFDQKALGVIE